jgi:precorrin-3B C17-methyltransferase
MSGKLWIVGLGPGAEDLTTPRAASVLSAATDLVGYATYLNRVPVRPGQRVHASDNREEIVRADMAIDMALSGRQVAVVSGGDPGVFAMAAAIFEALEAREAEDRRLDVEVVPGVSAVLAAAARIGAPCGGDFCVINLSDNLKPFDLIQRRVRVAAEAGFVQAFYNPSSKARPHQLGEVLDMLRAILPGDVPVIFAVAVSRPDEAILRTTIAKADAADADMRTLVIVGTAETRVLARPDKVPWIYTPRAVGRVPA